MSLAIPKTIPTLPDTITINIQDAFESPEHCYCYFNTIAEKEGYLKKYILAYLLTSLNNSSKKVAHKNYAQQISINIINQLLSSQSLYTPQEIVTIIYGKKITEVVESISQEILTNFSNRSGSRIRHNMMSFAIETFGSCYDFLVACTGGDSYTDILNTEYIDKIPFFKDLNIHTLQDLQDFAYSMFSINEVQQEYLQKLQGKKSETIKTCITISPGELKNLETIDIPYSKAKELYVEHFCKFDTISSASEVGRKSIAQVTIAIKTEKQTNYKADTYVTVHYYINQEHRTQYLGDGDYDKLLQSLQTEYHILSPQLPLQVDNQISSQVTYIIGQVNDYMNKLSLPTYRSTPNGEMTSSSAPSLSEINKITSLSNPSIYQSLKAGLLPLAFMYWGDGRRYTTEIGSVYHKRISAATEKMKQYNENINFHDTFLDIPCGVMLALGGGNLKKEREVIKEAKKQGVDLELFNVDLFPDNNILCPMPYTMFQGDFNNIDTIKRIRGLLGNRETKICVEFGCTFGNPIIRKNTHGIESYYEACIESFGDKLFLIKGLLDQGESYIIDVATTKQTTEYVKEAYSNHGYMMTNYMKSHGIECTFGGVQVVTGNDGSGQYFVTCPIYIDPPHNNYTIQNPDTNENETIDISTLYMIPSFRFNLEDKGENSLHDMITKTGFEYKIIGHDEETGIARIQMRPQSPKIWTKEEEEQQQSNREKAKEIFNREKNKARPKPPTIEEIARKKKNLY